MDSDFNHRPNIPLGDHSRLRVLIVDGHPIALAGLAYILERSMKFQVCGQSGSLKDAIEAVFETNPDLVILDLDLGSESGLGLLQIIRPRFPALPIFIWSARDVPDSAGRVLKAGANGYFSKRETPEGILRTLQVALERNIGLRPDLKEQELGNLAGRTENGDNLDVARLSNRELQIFEMLGRGLTTKVISQTLAICVKTVDAHYAKMKFKLGCASVRELNRFGYHWHNHGAFPKNWIPMKRAESEALKIGCAPPAR